MARVLMLEASVAFASEGVSIAYLALIMLTTLIGAWAYCNTVLHFYP